MKSIKTFAIIALLIGFLFSATSCVVMPRKAGRSAKGWHKNSNNPHHINSTNPGNSRGNSKK